MSKKKYRDRSRAKLLNLQKRRNWQARVNGNLLQEKYVTALGQAIWFLLVIVRDCDWQSGIWQGTARIVAQELGVTDRTLRYWLQRIKAIDGVETFDLGYEGLEIHLPTWLIPNSKEVIKDSGRILPRSRKKVVEDTEEKSSRSGKSTSGMEHAGRLFKDRVKSLSKTERKDISATV